MTRADPRLALSLQPVSGPALAPAGGDSPRLAALRQQLEPDLTVFTPDAPAGSVRSSRSRIGVAFPDGTAVTGLLPLAAPNGPSASSLILGSTVFIVLNLAVLLWWTMRAFTAPLARFAQAAARLLPRPDPTPLPERGPYQVRTAARAFDRLQDRIRRMVADRTRMLAAVGHDLRTPVTRLRLRAEFIEDAATRTQMLRDLDQMAAMIHAALSYLRDGKAAEGRALVDLASLLQTVCDELADMGHTVTYDGPDHLAALVRPDELRRAVVNLVENAVKFGTHAVVGLRLDAADVIEIEVADDGPGIPDADKAAMLEPFARGDAARGLEAASGFGLGLSIARTIAEAHGGALSLHDRQPCGLSARLRLPRLVPGTGGGGPPADFGAARTRVGCAELTTAELGERAAHLLGHGGEVARAAGEVGRRVRRLQVAPALERAMRPRLDGHDHRLQHEVAAADALAVRERPDRGQALAAGDLAPDDPVERAALAKRLGAARDHAGRCVCSYGRPRRRWWARFSSIQSSRSRIELQPTQSFRRWRGMGEDLAPQGWQGWNVSPAMSIGCGGARRSRAVRRSPGRRPCGTTWTR